MTTVGAWEAGYRRGRSERLQHADDHIADSDQPLEGRSYRRTRSEWPTARPANRQGCDLVRPWESTRAVAIIADSENDEGASGPGRRTTSAARCVDRRRRCRRDRIRRRRHRNGASVDVLR